MTDGLGHALPQGKPLGIVVEGSLTRGVEIRLGPSTSVEDIKLGTFVTVQGENLRFFGVVTDVALGASNPGLKYTPPDVEDPFIAEVVAGTTAYGIIRMLPALTMPAVQGDSVGPRAMSPPMPRRGQSSPDRPMTSRFCSAMRRASSSFRVTAWPSGARSMP